MVYVICVMGSKVKTISNVSLCFLPHCALVVLVAARLEPVSLAVLTLSLAMLMTFLFQLRNDIWSMRVLHLVKVALGHLGDVQVMDHLAGCASGQCLMLQ